CISSLFPLALKRPGILCKSHSKAKPQLISEKLPHTLPQTHTHKHTHTHLHRKRELHHIYIEKKSRLCPLKCKYQFWVTVEQQAARVGVGVGFCLETGCVITDNTLLQ